MTSAQTLDTPLLEKALISLHQVLRQQAEYIQHTYQISRLEMDLIGFVVAKGPQKMKDVSDHFHVKLSTLTSIIDKAERKRILKRVASKEDRRVVFLDVTRKGKNIHQDFEQYLKQATEKLEEQMDPVAFGQFVSGIDTLAKIELN